MKAVIFDMDGVLIDSEPLHFEVDKLVLKNLNIHESDHYLEKFVGYTNPAMWNMIKTEHPIEKTIEELIELQMTMKLKYLEENDYDAMEGVTALLEELKENKIPTAIASSSPGIFIEAVLYKIGIAHYFDQWISGEELGRSKPEPDVFLKAAEWLGVDPNDCVVIEDSKSGTIAAKKAGMKCIGFQNSNSGDQDLSMADRIVNNMSEINYQTLKALFE